MGIKFYGRVRGSQGCGQRTSLHGDQDYGEVGLCPDGKCKARSPFSGSRLAFAFAGAESLGSSNFWILGPCLSDLVPGTLLSVLLGEGVY